MTGGWVFVYILMTYNDGIVSYNIITSSNLWSDYPFSIVCLGEHWSLSFSLTHRFLKRRTLNLTLSLPASDHCRIWFEGGCSYIWTSYTKSYMVPSSYDRSHMWSIIIYKSYTISHIRYHIRQYYYTCVLSYDCPYVICVYSYDCPYVCTHIWLSICVYSYMTVHMCVLIYDRHMCVFKSKFWR